MPLHFKLWLRQKLCAAALAPLTPPDSLGPRSIALCPVFMRLRDLPAPFTAKRTETLVTSTWALPPHDSH